MSGKTGNVILKALAVLIAFDHGEATPATRRSYPATNGATKYLNRTTVRPAASTR